MNDDAQRMARANRAQRAWEEFFGPMIAELRSEYASRMVDVANQELDRNKRADKLTALSNAIRIVEALEGGMLATIQDGDIAKMSKLRADKIEKMSAPQRRLLGISPLR